MSQNKQFGMPPIVRHKINKIKNRYLTSADEDLQLEERSVRVSIRQDIVFIKDRDSGKTFHSNDILRGKGVDDVNINAKTLVDRWRITLKEFRKSCVFQDA